MRHQKIGRLHRSQTNAPQRTRRATIKDHEKRMFAIPGYANSRERLSEIQSAWKRRGIVIIERAVLDEYGAASKRLNEMVIGGDARIHAQAISFMKVRHHPCAARVPRYKRILPGQCRQNLP